MVDLIRVLFGGLIEPIPARAPGALRLGFLFWRVTIVILPLYLGVGGVLLSAAGEELVREAHAMTEDPLLVFLTLGMVLLIALVFMIMGTIITALGLGMFVLAPLVFFLLSWSLGRALRGESSGTTWAAVTMGLALFVAFLLGSVVASFAAELTGLPALAPVVMVLGMAAPAAGLVLVLQRDSRRWSTWRSRRRALPQTVAPDQRPVRRGYR